MDHEEQKLQIKSTLKDLKKLERSAHCQQYAAPIIFGGCLGFNYMYCTSACKCFAASLLPACFAAWLKDSSEKTLTITSHKIVRLKQQQRELT